MILFAIISILTSFTTASRQSRCISGRYYFNPSRISLNETNDIFKYDYQIDYGSQNFQPFRGGAFLHLTKDKKGHAAAQGIRISTTQFVQYAKISVKMSAIPYAGAITTFITMSKSKDEIDW